MLPEAIKRSHLYKEESQMIEDEGNHHSAGQGSLSEQEIFEWTEITFIL